MGSEVGRGTGMGNLLKLFFYKQAGCVLQKLLELQVSLWRRGQWKTLVSCCNI